MPEQPPHPPQYCTLVPNRGYGGKYKFHKTLGHAKSAIVNGGYGKIWIWNSGQWDLLYDVERYTRRDNMPWNIEEANARAVKEELAQIEKRKRTVRQAMKELEGL